MKFMSLLEKIELLALLHKAAASEAACFVASQQSGVEQPGFEHWRNLFNGVVLHVEQDPEVRAAMAEKERWAKEAELNQA